MAVETQSATWPMPKFYFSVNLGGAYNAAFQEVTGMDDPSQDAQYRHGDHKSEAVKIPAIPKYRTVTLKRGIFVNDDHFAEWNAHIKADTAERTTVIIKLLDEKGQPTMAWTLKNAWPVKIIHTDLQSAGNDVAIESLELAHEGITVSNP